MKAVIFDHHGDIDQLRLMEVPDPKIEKDEVLIKVQTCALNHRIIQE